MSFEVVVLMVSPAFLCVFPFSPPQKKLKRGKQLGNEMLTLFALLDHGSVEEGFAIRTNPGGSLREGCRNGHEG